MRKTDPAVTQDDSGDRDAAWVKAAVAGDSEAFGQLVEVYQRRVVAVAYRLLGNSHDALEVAQESFLRAFRSLDRLKEPARFGPWMMRIVSNLALNARRSRRSISTVTLDETRGTEGAMTGEGEPVVKSFGPDRQLEDRELQKALDAALDGLPDKQRLSLVLFAIEGWAQKDVAELLECSIENVKWNVFQARKRIREKLPGLLSEKIEKE